MAERKEFNLEIYTPDRVFFKGKVQSLTLTTKYGEMGILYHTLPTVTILAPGIMKILQDNKWMESAAGEGFVSVARDGVTVMTEAAYWPHEFDDMENEEDHDEEFLRQRKAKSVQEYKMAKAQLALQFAKLKIKNRDK